jgi:hypothetical protein
VRQLATYKVNPDGSITKKMASGAEYTVSKNDSRYQRVANEAVGAGGNIKGPISGGSSGSSSSGGSSGTKKNSGGGSSSSGISSSVYEEIVRKAKAGIPLTDPTPEKQSIWDAYSKAYSVDNQKKEEKLTIEDYLDQFKDQLDNYNMPYEQALRDILSQAPSYTPKSQEELQEIAENYASLNITPQLEALQRSIEQAVATANSQTEAINAAYAGVPAQTQSMLDEARRYAQESAIARGAGQSGVVSWETEKRTTPIMQQAQQAEQEKAAKLAAVANWLANVQSQGEEQKKQLSARQGDLTQQYLQLLSSQDQARSASDWERIFGSIGQLSNMAQNANFNSQNWAANLLPYFMQTTGQEMANQLDQSQVFGEVPNIPSSNAPSNQKSVSMDNEKQYLLSQLEQAKKTGNKGLESWVLAQAKQYGINLGV